MPFRKGGFVRYRKAAYVIFPVFIIKSYKDIDRKHVMLKVIKLVCTTLIAFLVFNILTTENGAIYTKQYLFGLTLSLFSQADTCVYFCVEEMFFKSLDISRYCNHNYQ